MLTGVSFWATALNTIKKSVIRKKTLFFMICIQLITLIAKTTDRETYGNIIGIS